MRTIFIMFAITWAGINKKSLGKHSATKSLAIAGDGVLLATRAGKNSHSNLLAAYLQWNHWKTS